MAIIKTLKDFLTKTTLYPITKTQAVYDDTVGRLDSYLQNTLGAEPIDDVVGEESTDLIDADTLGGRYTAEDLDAMPKSTAIEDYANIEPPITDADRLGGKYTAKDIEQEFTKLNSSLANIEIGSSKITYSGDFPYTNVTFNKKFSNPPAVFCTSPHARAFISAEQITNNGFKANGRVVKDTLDNEVIPFTYMAIEL